MPKTTLTETKPATPAPTPHPKRYDEAFKRQAVENWLRSGKSGAQIADELGISYPSLKEWKRRYGGDAMPQRTDPQAEIRALRAELARVREQRDILKKSLGILHRPGRLLAQGHHLLALLGLTRFDGHPERAGRGFMFS